MSRFRKTHFVRRITRKFVWNLIFWTIGHGFFSADAQADFAGSNAPTASVGDIGVVSTDISVDSNQPASSAAGLAIKSLPPGVSATNTAMVNSTTNQSEPLEAKAPDTMDDVHPKTGNRQLLAKNPAIQGRPTAAGDVAGESIASGNSEIRPAGTRRAGTG